MQLCRLTPALLVLWWRSSDGVGWRWRPLAPAHNGGRQLITKHSSGREEAHYRVKTGGGRLHAPCYSGRHQLAYRTIDEDVVLTIDCGAGVLNHTCTLPITHAEDTN
jgi:hypothetical protein